MKNEIFNTPWLVRPQALEAIAQKYIGRIGGWTAGAQPSAFFSFFEQNTSKPEDLLSVHDGVGTIRVSGVLEKVSGEDPGMDVIGQAFDLAMKSKKVKAIVLDIDSPGGTVDGTHELAQKVRSSRGLGKPIIAYANGLMASAAYWIGSAADLIVASETAEVGSIGVAMLHHDFSKALEAMGVKETPITAGRYKRIASREKPLSDEARDYLQGFVDDIYSLFVESVSANRGVTVEKALAMADGKAFIGRKAREVGLVDLIGTMATAVAQARERSPRMDITQLKDQHPDLYKQVLDAGHAEGLKCGENTGLEKGKADGIKEGIATERARVCALLDAQADPAATLAAIKAGSSESEAFKAFFQAEKDRKATGLQALAAAAPPAIGHTAPTTGAETTFEIEVEKLVKAGAKRSAAISSVVAAHPILHEAYLARINKGKE